MTTSNSVSWNANTIQIITQAMKYIGALGEGEQPTSEEYNDCLWHLNAMCKKYIAKNDYSPGLKMWLRQRGIAFLANNTGTYILGSQAQTGASYWTNSYMYTNSTGGNAANATTIKCATTSALSIQPQPASNAASTGALTGGMYVGIQLDNGQLYWTIVSSITNGTQFVIQTGLPSASNNINNLIFAFQSVATPPQVIESAVLRDSQQNDTPMTILTLEQWMTNPSKQSAGYIGDPISIYYEPDLYGYSGQGTGTLYTDVAGAQDTSKAILLSYMTEIQDFVNPIDEMHFPKEWAEALFKGLGRSIHPMFNSPWSKEQELQANEALRIARNSNNKRSTMGFCPGLRGEEIAVQWR